MTGRLPELFANNSLAQMCPLKHIATFFIVICVRLIIPSCKYHPCKLLYTISNVINKVGRRLV